MTPAGPPRRAAGPFALLLCGLLLIACNSAPPPSLGGGSVRVGGKITAGTAQEPDGMLAGGVSDNQAYALADVAPVMEGLLGRRAPTDSSRVPGSTDFWEPQLATEVPTLENGGVRIRGEKMTVTWKLRAGVRWHDGTAFGADDVVDTFNFWWLKFGAKNPTRLASTAGWDLVESVTKLDQRTVAVNFSVLYGAYLQLGSGPYGILPSHLLQKSWAAGGDLSKVKLPIAIPGAYSGLATWDEWLVGTGPFMFKEWVTGDHLTLVRNPDWWGLHRSYLDSITIKFEPDLGTQLADLRSGAIDLGVGFSSSMLSPLERLSRVRAKVVLHSAAEKLDLNLRNKYLADPVIRRAINMSIDKQKLIDTLLEGRSTVPPDSLLCLGLSAWCADGSVMTTRFDPAAAEAMLDTAGYRRATAGPEKGFRGFGDGSTIALDLSSASGDPLRLQEEVQIQADLEAIGLKVNSPFRNYRPGRLTGSYASGGVLSRHAFDLALHSSPPTGGEPDLGAGSYACDRIASDQNGGVGQNYSQECKPALDAAFRTGRSRVGGSERKAAYLAAQKILAADLPEIPLYQQLTVSAHSNRLGGYRATELFWFNNSAEWFVILNPPAASPS